RNSPARTGADDWHWEEVLSQAEAGRAADVFAEALLAAAYSDEDVGRCRRAVEDGVARFASRRLRGPIRVGVCVGAEAALTVVEGPGDGFEFGPLVRGGDLALSCSRRSAGHLGLNECRIIH